MRTREQLDQVVGDGYDNEPLLKAKAVGKMLELPPKAVYALPIPRVVLGPRRIRWRPADVSEYINSHLVEG